jgi:hypothetical protein
VELLIQERKVGKKIYEDTLYVNIEFLCKTVKLIRYKLDIRDFSGLEEVVKEVEDFLTFLKEDYGEIKTELLK